MTSREVLNRLANVQPVELAGPALLARLLELEKAGQLTLEATLQLQGEIDPAVAAMERHVNRSQEVSRRCLTLRPSPSRQAPKGF